MKISDKLYGWLEAAANHGEDFSDGALFAHLESQVEAFNKKYHKNYDPYDAMMEFLDLLGKEING